jgi:hypothetical protein
LKGIAFIYSLCLTYCIKSSVAFSTLKYFSLYESIKYAPLQGSTFTLNSFMYTNVWLKYLPVIRIVLKKSLNEEQTLNLNVPDFERSGLQRKSGYKFQIRFKKGKLDDLIIDTPLASSLVSAMMEDNKIKDILESNDFNISLNPKFALTFKHIPSTE